MRSVNTLLCAVLMCQMAVGVLSTANPAANAQTKRLHAFLNNLGGKLLSGAFGGWTNVYDFNGFSMNLANEIQRATSKSPAVYGLECSPGWKTSAPGREADIVECFNNDIAAYAKKGGLLAISSQVPNPLYAGNNPGNNAGAFRTPINNAQFATIFQNGSPARNRWLAIMAKMAVGFLKYQSMGITVLFRPFHEMNGEWFWWGALSYDLGNRERMELYKKLWIDLFTFMQRKGVNNLLWVYAPDHGRDYKTGFYPGSNYVDLVGLDFYSDDPNAMQGYNEMIGLGKPFCLPEVGPKTNFGNFDYGNFVNAVLTRYPRTTYFLAFNDQFSPVRNKGAPAAFNNPRVLNLGQVRY